MNRLYRLCLHSSRSLARLKRFDKNSGHFDAASRVFARTVLNNLEIKSFTNGEAALQAFDTGEDLDANILRNMFREGSSEDFDRLLANMPCFLRYVRAVNNLNEYHERLASLWEKDKELNKYCDSSVCAWRVPYSYQSYFMILTSLRG